MTHELTDKQREVIYLAEIFPLYIHRIPPQDNPQSVITGGQPGAGKSGLKEIAKEKFKGAKFVTVDADVLREGEHLFWLTFLAIVARIPSAVSIFITEDAHSVGVGI